MITKNIGKQIYSMYLYLTSELFYLLLTAGVRKRKYIYSFKLLFFFASAYMKQTLEIELLEFFSLKYT